LPQPSDESSSSNRVQNAELNPLLNPLLADNMGKWAEVYFTNPPEKRDQAVLALLRELEAQNPGRQTASGEPVAPAETEVVHCQRCGRDNPVTHRFCGMCGAILWSGDPTRQEQPSPSGYREEPAEADQAAEGFFSGYEPAATNSLSLFRSVAQKDYDDEESGYEARPAPSYRFYIGAVLAVVLLVLGYTAWRSAQSSQNPDESSAAPPVTREASPESAAPAAQPGRTPDANKTPEKAAPSKAPEAAAGNEKAPPDAKSKAARASTAPEAAVSASQPGASAENGKGSEELATAMRYLYGTQGEGEDKAEAAKWLWKSISKHNGPATLILADLYLKGDGVAKNCDQARVLLDSAARKGISGAGERLRNLPAFGCQ
jgi:hypothetical protein